MLLLCCCRGYTHARFTFALRKRRYDPVSVEKKQKVLSTKHMWLYWSQCTAWHCRSFGTFSSVIKRQQREVFTLSACIIKRAVLLWQQAAMQRLIHSVRFIRKSKPVLFSISWEYSRKKGLAPPGWEILVLNPSQTLQPPPCIVPWCNIRGPTTPVCPIPPTAPHHQKTWIWWNGGWSSVSALISNLKTTLITS